MYCYDAAVFISVDNCPWLHLGQLSMFGLDTRADMKKQLRGNL